MTEKKSLSIPENETQHDTRDPKKTRPRKERSRSDKRSADERYRDMICRRGTRLGRRVMMNLLADRITSDCLDDRDCYRSYAELFHADVIGEFLFERILSESRWRLSEGRPTRDMRLGPARVDLSFFQTRNFGTKPVTSYRLTIALDEDHRHRLMEVFRQDRRPDDPVETAERSALGRRRQSEACPSRKDGIEAGAEDEIERLRRTIERECRDARANLSELKTDETDPDKTR